MLALLLVAACTASPSPAPRGGRMLLEGSQAAAATVVGRIRDLQVIDQGGYKATLVIEQMVAGNLPSKDRVVIAWEELSQARGVRFKDGERVLVALSPLPSASLWRTRFPDAASAPVFIVAQDGEAFLVHPNPESISTLASYLALAKEAKAGSAGADALAAMIARSAPDLAVAAASQLNGLEASTELTPAAQNALAQALAQRESRQLQSLIIEIAARFRAGGLRAALARLADTHPELAFNALMAVAAIDGTMSEEEARRLLSDPNPAKRMVAVRLARGAILEWVLPVLRSDPDPKVRAAAAHALIEQRGAAALSQVIAALSDPELFTRSEAARALAQLGAAAVPPLLDVAKTGSVEAGQAAVLALEITGDAGGAALHDLAENHPDDRIRRLAKLALGQVDDHH